jgi:hypothetical protein
MPRTARRQTTDLIFRSQGLAAVVGQCHLASGIRASGNCEGCAECLRRNQVLCQSDRLIGNRDPIHPRHSVGASARQPIQTQKCAADITVARTSTLTRNNLAPRVRVERGVGIADIDYTPRLVDNTAAPAGWRNTRRCGNCSPARCVVIRPDERQQEHALAGRGAQNLNLRLVAGDDFTTENLAVRCIENGELTSGGHGGSALFAREDHRIRN